MDGRFVGEINEHAHPPSQDKIEATKIKVNKSQIKVNLRQPGAS